MTAPRTLLLDFGGTLAIERRSRPALYAAVASARGLEVDEARMGALMAEAHAALPIVCGGHFRYSRGWFERFIEVIFVERLGLSSADLPDAQEELFSVFADARTFRLFPGALEVLGRARRRGHRVAVVSNWSYALAPLLEDLGLRPDAVLCSAVEGLEKPATALFRRALERLGTEAEGALHVGDSLTNDVHGARRAGLDAVLLDRTGSPAPEGVAVIRSLDEVLP